MESILKVSLNRAFACMIIAYSFQVVGSAQQKIMAIKEDKEQVTVTITGVDGYVITKKTFTKNKQQLKLNWARGRNTIKAVYKDGTKLPDLTISGIQGSDNYVPEGSELLISKNGMRISLPANAISAKL